MQYFFKVLVNVNNEKAIKAIYATEHGDASSFPDKIHEQDIVREISKFLNKPLAPEEVFITKMHLLENHESPEHINGELKMIEVTSLDDLSSQSV